MSDEVGNEGRKKCLLYVYDLSGGFAAQMSMALLGKQIDGVWHTSVVMDGVEYFYGGGVQQAMAGTTPYGQPVDIIYLGDTHIPHEVLLEYIEELKKVFTPEAYDLLRHNCNNFSNELATFLTGSGIPAHITSLPADVLSTPMGRMLAPMLGGVESQLGSVQQGDGPLQLQSPIPGVALPQYQPDPTQPATQPAVSDDAPNLSTSEQHETAASAAASVYHSAAKVARGDQGGAAAVAVGNQTKQDATLKGQVNPADAKGKAQAQESNSRESHVRQAATKAQFEELVRAEFAKVMASGAISANEAAIQAVALARARANSMDAGSLGC